MRQIISFALFVYSICVTGQPIIKTTFAPQKGKTYYTYSLKKSTQPDFWKEGPATQWDFRYLNSYDSTEVNKYEEMISSYFMQPFESATHYTRNDENQQTTIKYYYASADSFCYLGYYSSHPLFKMTAHWNDPQTEIKLPITYKDTQTDNAYFNFFGITSDKQDTSTSYIWKYSKIIADGYGTMLYKNIVLDSVLRVRITTTTINKWYNGYNKNIRRNDTVTETRLVWLSNQYSQPIVTVVFTSPYGENNNNATIYYNSSIYLGTENHGETGQIQCYPNPANDKIKIEGVKNLASVEIRDLTGKSIEILTDNFDQIHVAHLPTGMYLLYATNEQGDVAIIKFIKD